MKQKESYEKRLEMAHMHDEFLKRLEAARDKKEYVEVSWLCYAIFEQRINRIIEKHILKCPRGKRGKQEHPVSISIRIGCLKKLVKMKYGPYANFDGELLGKIGAWCKKRNTLIHGLVSLDNYKKYDKEFETLAMDGYPLVIKLYEEARKVREWCRADNSLGKFPEIKCQCKHRCIFEEN